MLSDSAFKENRVILIKNLAQDLLFEDIKALLKRLGAINFEVIMSTQPWKHHRALLELKSSEECWKLIKSLHQFNLLDIRISLEFAYNRPCLYDSVQHQNTPTEPSTNPKKDYQEWVEHLLLLSPNWLPRVGVKSMQFAYPKASLDILTNIVRCAFSVPEFYTQVLHLMNRFHLPSPFCDPAEFPGSLWVVSGVDHKTSFSHNVGCVQAPVEMEVSSGPESEMESESDTNIVIKRPAKTETRKRHVLQPGAIFRPDKRLDARGKELRPRLTNRSPSPDNVIMENCISEPVFEEGSDRRINPPKIEVRLKSSIVPRELPETEVFGDFGVLPRAMTEYSTHISEKKDPAANSTMHEINQIPLPNPTTFPESLLVDDAMSRMTPLTPKELWEGRMPQADLLKHPVFSTKVHETSPPLPSSRLYIKNLSKSTNEDDLWRVFGSFKTPSGASQFSIQLLTGGRMKGQAFIGFESIEMATSALEAVNGYLLHGRPMFAQFARGAIAKPDPKSLIS